MTKAKSRKSGKGGDLRAEVWPVDRIRPSATNTKHHPPSQIERIADSIREFGFAAPVLVGENGDLISGHGRLLAANHLGLGEIPVIVAVGATEADRRALRIACNRLGELSRWDRKALASEVADLMDLEFDVGLLGFTDMQFAKMLDDRDGGPGEDNAPPIGEVPVSAPGDAWRLGDHRLACGDATDPEIVALAKGSLAPTLMVTDPPYGVRYDPSFRTELKSHRGKVAVGKVESDDRADWREAWALSGVAAAYVWHSATKADIVAESLEAAKFRIESQNVWIKPSSIISRGHYNYQHEVCVFAIASRRRPVWNAGAAQGTVWRIGAGNSRGKTFHGTQKPVECMRRPIRHSSAPGDAIFDPFIGSGTTLIACESTERVAVGIDVDPLYVDLAIRRWQESTGREAVHEASGEKFADREKKLPKRNPRRSRKGKGDGKAGR